MKANSYEVRFQGAARRDIRSLDSKTSQRIGQVIEQLKANPRGTNCTPLVGYKNFWRLRAGDYRIIYQINDTELIILIVKVGHRKEIYRRF